MEFKKEPVPNIEEILDQLIANARALVESSHCDISEQTLKPLQEEQEKLLEQLKASEKDLSLTTDFVKRLETFVELNTQYIQNLTKVHGTIHFEPPSLRATKLTPQKKKEKTPSPPK